MRPDLLLFDEPTSALDPELVGEVLVVMRDLAREGMTMVIVTHEMGFAREAATRALFLDRGRVVETGSPDRFFSNPETERARQFLQRYAGDSANGRR
jgi:polar amino acid transport system ATP-binding protein